MKKTLVSIFSIVLVIIMLVSSILPANALSVGDEGYIVNTGSETYTGYDYSYSVGGGTGGGEFLHMTLRDDGNTPVYCVEPNAPFTETYYRINTTASDSYWKSLSKSQQEGIALALMFGYPTQNAKALGVTSADDAYAATQAVVWEYAAGVRKSPSEFDTSKPEYDAWYKAIKGSPAETAYKSLRTQMKKYMESYGYNRDTLIANTKILMLGSGTGNPEQAMIYYTGDTPNIFGVIEVYKTDENGNGLAGAKFTVYNSKGEIETTIGPTNSKGYAKSADLPYGKYKVVETVFPENYGPNGATSWTVTVDDTVKGIATITATNKKLQWHLHLTKNVAEGVNMNLSLKGAEYTLSKDGTPLKVYKTDSNGKFTTDVYPFGTGYTITETKAPTGYAINNEVYELDSLIEEATDIDADNILDISVSTPEYTDGGQFLIYKKHKIEYTDYPANVVAEAGAEFVIYSKKFDSYETAKIVGDPRYFDSCVTDERGRSVWTSGGAMSRALIAGEYIVEQRKAANDNLILINPVEVTISSSNNGKLAVTSKTFTNELKKKDVVLVKKDKETGKIIKDYSATFQIYEADTNELVVFEVGEKYNDTKKIDTFTTVNGKATLPTQLPYGDYLLVETKAPSGYILNNEPVPFTVDENSGDVIEVEMKNPPKKGTITIEKKGSQFTDVTTSKTDFGTKYTAKFTDTYLAGATFEITAAEDIKTKDGTVRLKKGALADTITTKSTGSVKSKELYPGNYIITETVAPSGYKTSDPKPVTVLESSNNKLTNIVAEIYNDKGSIYASGEKTASVWVTEEDGNTITSSQVTKPGAGFTFGLFANENIKGSTDKAVIKKDSLVDVIVTDKNGKINFKGNYPFGKYYIKELAAPSDDYVLSTSKYELSLTPDKLNDEISVTISLKDKIHNNTKPGLGKVIKIDAETKEPMEGVLIQIKDTNGKVWRKGYTNKNGELNFWLESGKYVAQELETKEGYILDSKEYPFTIVPGNEPTVVTIKNVPQKGTISIEKYGSQFTGVNVLDTKFGKSKTPIFEDEFLAGVEFEIRAQEDIVSPDGKVQYKKGDVVQTLVSSNKGAVTSKELWPGKYLVIETKTLDGYKIDSTPRVVNLKAEDNKSVTAYTEKYYNSKSSAEINGIKNAIIWKKTENGQLVNYSRVTVPGVGFTFGLYAAENITLTDGADGLKKDDLIAIGVTDNSGKLQFALDLPFGEYYVKELATPEDHYIIPDTKYPVSVKTTETTGDTIVVDAFAGELLNDFPVEPVKIKKVNSETNEPMADVLIEIKDKAEKVWFRGYTDKNGEINVELEPGDYIATEVETPEGYLLNTEEYPFTVVKGAKDPVELLIKNIPLKGIILIEKYGTQFTSVDVLNSAYGNVNVPMFEAEYLAGVEFEIRAKEDIYSPDGKLQIEKGTLVQTLVSSSNGMATSDELWPGKYEVVETKTLDGYKIDSTPREVNVVGDSNKEVTAYTEKYLNTKSTAEINGVKNAIVWKRAQNDGLVNYTRVTVPGVGFTFGLYAAENIALADGSDGLKKDDLIAIGVTDVAGKLQFALDLPFGEYYVKELEAPEEHYIVPDTKYPVSVKTTATTGATIVIDAFEGELLNDFPVEPVKIKKVNSETNEPMADVLIEIKDLSGKVWFKDYTVENGEINVVLEPGDYIATEVETPKGYVINTEEYPFTVVKGAKEPVEILIKNVPLKGTISLEKFGTQFTGLKKSDTDFGTAYMPVFEEKYLDGAVFEIRAKEDIYSPDGKLQYKKDTVVETLTSTLDGPVTSKELWLGKYLVVETATKHGYKLDTIPKEIEITNDGTKRVTAFSEKFFNDKATAEINAVKKAVVWKNNENGVIIGRELIEIPGVGFTFGLFASEDITLYNGEEGLKKDTLITTAVSDENGNIQFALDLPFGEYYIKELAAPEAHYTIPVTKYPVSIKTTETTGETIVVKAYDGEILNDFPKYPVTITKTDLVTSEPVPGALVEIRDKDNNVVYREYTSKDGTLPDIVLEPGDYVFEETVAPEGYIRNTTIFEFTITADGTVKGKVDFTNTPTKVTITKTDAVNGKPVAGAEITIYEASPDEATADEFSNEVYKALTDTNGQISVSYLKVGKWYIYKETKAANGFAVNKNTFAFMINEDGTITGDTTLVDDYTRFKIYKVNEKDKPMKGVVFTMYDEQGNPVATATTDEAGVAEFVGFLEGKYTIKETKTWDNYDLAPDSIKIVNDGNWDNEAETSSTTVKNYPTVIPPKTGDNSNVFRWVGIGGASLAVIALVLLIIKRKKK